MCWTLKPDIICRWVHRYRCVFIERGPQTYFVRGDIRPRNKEAIVDSGRPRARVNSSSPRDINLVSGTWSALSNASRAQSHSGKRLWKFRCRNLTHTRDFCWALRSSVASSREYFKEGSLLTYIFQFAFYGGGNVLCSGLFAGLFSHEIALFHCLQPFSGL